MKWINRSLVQAPRNGTLTHSVSFTPAAAGSLLVCVAEGSVTSSTPAGWTLPDGGFAVSNTGLYVWWKIATAGESALTTTHNGSNYPVAFIVYEFAAGSAFVASVAGAGIAPDNANPALTGLTGTNLVLGVVAGGITSTSNATTAWSGTGSPVEDVDVVAPGGGTDGYMFSLAYVESFTGASWQPTGSISGSNLPPNKETLTFAVSVAAGGGAPTALQVTYVSAGVVHAGELFYWDGSTRHDLNYVHQVP